MKHILLALSLLCAFTKAFAQKNHLFTDIGTPPGLSASYNYKLTRHFGAGIGLQVNNTFPTIISGRQFSPAAFVDLRVYLRPKKVSQFFAFLNPGIDFYHQKNHYKFADDNNSLDYIPGDAGFFLSLGLGYFRPITKHGAGPYVSLKMISNWYGAKRYILRPSTGFEKMPLIDGNAVFSLGFKF
jgi:hypothetical protein